MPLNLSVQTKSRDNSLACFTEISLPERGTFVSCLGDSFAYEVLAGEDASSIPNAKAISDTTFHGISLTAPNQSVAHKLLAQSLLWHSQQHKFAVEGTYTPGKHDPFNYLKGYYILLDMQSEGGPTKVVLFVTEAGQLYQVYAFNHIGNDEVLTEFEKLRAQPQGKAKVSYPNPGFTYRHNDG